MTPFRPEGVNRVLREEPAGLRRPYPCSAGTQQELAFTSSKQFAIEEGAIREG